MKRDVNDRLREGGPDAVRADFDKAPRAKAAEIGETLTVFDKWLALTDKTPIYAALGTVAANLLPGDPVWLGLIGPPSSAKTEILNSTARLPNVVQAASITVAGLLSGTPNKQRAKGAQGGLLQPDRRLRHHRAERLRLDPLDAHRDARRGAGRAARNL